MKADLIFFFFYWSIARHNLLSPSHSYILVSSSAFQKMEGFIRKVMQHSCNTLCAVYECLSVLCVVQEQDMVDEAENWEKEELKHAVNYISVS